jgi:acetoin utilization deacetylase AcuC-like enzyme
MKVGLAIDPRFRVLVAPPGHPERPERLAAVERALEERGLKARATPVHACMATRAELARVHASSYLDGLERALAPEAFAAGVEDEAAWLDADTYASPRSWEVAQLAAGTAVALARAVAAGELASGAAFVRPPGHHATADRAMGFCLLNNVAVAAGALLDEGLRVAVVDFDVHHGNGTQAIFYEEPRVLYLSTHQWPLYPGTGAVDERGAGAGRGATVNVPLPAGAGDGALLAACDEVLVPALERFAPDVVLASAGFDAHRDDPLAALEVSAHGYACITRRLQRVAAGRLAAVLEGGYHLEALGASAAALVAALLGDPVDEPPPAPLPEAQRAAVARARRSLVELPPPRP